jgi:D-alanyl-D-alanine carboxypeptidase
VFFLFLICALFARTPAHYVVDHHGNVIYANNEKALIHPASLTKKMTLYILFQDLKKGKIKPTTQFVVSKRASTQAPSKLGLRPGERITVANCINALITKSANDVACVVAENISGNVARFASRMNTTAKMLNMKRTRFCNPSGLPDKRQVTTALDMSILGRALFCHFPDFYKKFNTQKFYFKNKLHHNHNKLLGRVYGLDGIKTGYIDASGFNISTSVARNGKRIFAVVIGGPSAKERDRFAMHLIESAFKKTFQQYNQSYQKKERTIQNLMDKIM